MLILSYSSRLSAHVYIRIGNRKHKLRYSVSSILFLVQNNASSAVVCKTADFRKWPIKFLLLARIFLIRFL